MSRPAPAPRRQARGRQGREQGRGAEVLAAVLLMAKGYQILGFRLKTPFGEIDLLARRGATLAVIEVKRRLSLDEAAGALTAYQQDRLHRAAEHLVRHRPGLRQLALRFDLIALAPGRFPRHVHGVCVGAP